VLKKNINIQLKASFAGEKFDLIMAQRHMTRKREQIYTWVPGLHGIHADVLSVGRDSGQSHLPVVSVL
jgi:hypothetical protein